MTHSPPLTAASALALLEVLKTPDHPHFAQTLQRLTTLNPSAFSPDERTAFLGALGGIIQSLEAQQSTVAAELAKLRAQASVQNAYKGPSK